MLKPGALSARYIAPSDAVAAYLDFPSWTRFLGADEIFDLCNSPASDRATLSWSYDSMVPSYALPREHRSALRGAPGRFVAITDAEVFHHRALTDAVPGFIQQMDGAHGEDGWDFVLLMLQWQVVSRPSFRRCIRFAVRATAVGKRLFPSLAGRAGRLCPLRAARLGAPQRLTRCRDPGESRARRQAPAALRGGGQLGACRLHPPARRGRAQGSAPRRARARALRSKATDLQRHSLSPPVARAGAGRHRCRALCARPAAVRYLPRDSLGAARIQSARPPAAARSTGAEFRDAGLQRDFGYTSFII